VSRVVVSYDRGRSGTGMSVVLHGWRRGTLLRSRRPDSRKPIMLPICCGPGQPDDAIRRLSQRLGPDSRISGSAGVRPRSSIGHLEKWLPPARTKCLRMIRLCSRSDSQTFTPEGRAFRGSLYCLWVGASARTDERFLC
jgi:hypothetical protein